MSAILKPSWFSYALSGVLAIVASWALSGCYFGNKTVNQPVSTDGVTGFYETQPQTLKLCAATPGEICPSAPTNLIPAFISNILTNPVALELQDPSTRKAGLFPYNGGAGAQGFGVIAGPNKTLTPDPASGSQTLWDDPACTEQLDLSIEGSYTLTNGPWTSNTPNIPKSGRIQMTVTYTIGVAGSCTVSLQAMADCYADSTKCGSHSQSEVQTLFGPFISAAAMAATDISKVQSLAYEITYQ
jgi:hypothetical protein